MDLHIDEHDALDEQLESIPWSELVVQQRPFPRWVAYVASGVLAMAALGVVVARALPSGAQAPSEAAMSVVSTTPPVAPTVVPTVVSTTVPLYSEADLMALVPGSQEQLAAVRAEGFVRDYFGSGGRPDQVLGVVAALPDGAEVPAGDGGVSYVEWASVFRVEPLGDSLYRVGVVFRMLAGPDTSTLNRLDPSAVDVVVQVDTEGGAGVVDLPMPTELPGTSKAAVWPDPDEDVPATVVTAAKTQAAAWGSDPEVVAAMRGDTGWRVVVLVADMAGNRWPLSLWMDGSTVLDAPPWDVDG
ncbi:MAG TPA: hypothetical protein ENH00_06830 [Actinobacteria bacterium]|nr:hypothetical protein BMS3Bbin01_02414 [bacterium BMS3Bbin01]HDH25889.1 hypothetical protein [Actinomycetota bacterium]